MVQMKLLMNYQRVTIRILEAKQTGASSLKLRITKGKMNYRKKTYLLMKMS